VRKGIAPLAIVAVIGVVLILFITGSQLKNIGAMFIPAEMVNIGGENCQFVRPEFGRICCESSATTYTSEQFDKWIENKGTIWPDYFVKYAVKCGDDENTDSCKVYVKMDGIQVGAVRTVPFAFLDYCIGNSCEPNIRIVQGGQPGYEYKVVENLRPGQVLWIHGRIVYLHPEDALGKIHVFTKYHAFGLNVYEHGGRSRYFTRSCDISTLNWEDRKRIVRKAPSDIESLGYEKGSRIDYGECVNYVIDYEPVALDSSKRLIDYFGQKVYCVGVSNIDSPASLYSLEKIKTDDGSCFARKGNFIKSVDCCPGQIFGNYECKNFKWVKLEKERECAFDSDCPPSYGDWVSDPENVNRIMRQKCRLGKCVVEYKIVECQPPRTNCPEGFICEPRVGYKCVKQIGSEIVCGDKVCSKPYEDYVNCPEDCEPKPKVNWLAIILGSFVLSLIIMIALAIVTAFIPFLRPFTQYIRTPQGFVAGLLLLTILFSIIGVMGSFQGMLAMLR